MPKVAESSRSVLVKSLCWEVSFTFLQVFTGWWSLGRDHCMLGLGCVRLCDLSPLPEKISTFKNNSASAGLTCTFFTRGSVQSLRKRPSSPPLSVLFVLPALVPQRAELWIREATFISVSPRLLARARISGQLTR